MFIKRLLRLLVAWVVPLNVLVTPQGFGADLNLPEKNRPPIRERILIPQTMMVTEGQKDDSVGIPFSSNRLADFKQELETTLQIYGAEKFRDGVFFVLGASVSQEAKIQQNYEEALREAGLEDYNVRVKVLAAPDNLIQEKSVSLLKDALQRAQYFLLTRRLDFQIPHRNEVISGLASASLIEIPSVLFMSHAFEPQDAIIVATNHFALIAAYAVYSKTILNWLLRPSFQDARLKAVELFLKQLLLTVPYVANYNIFSNFSNILSYYETFGFDRTLAAFPNELLAFTTTQGLTLILQTMFYSDVIVKGFGQWANSQVGEENARLARPARSWLQTPILMINAVVVAMASSNWGEPIVQIGGAEINWGHAALLGLLVGGKTFFDRYPRALDRALPVYKKAEDKVSALYQKTEGLRRRSSTLIKTCASLLTLPKRNPDNK